MSAPAINIESLGAGETTQEDLKFFAWWIGFFDHKIDIHRQGMTNIILRTRAQILIGTETTRAPEVAPRSCPHGRTDGRMDDGRTADGRTARRTDGQTDGWTDGQAVSFLWGDV